jgi:IrrE N-terminal-like domain
MLLKEQNDIVRNRQSTAPVNVIALAHDLGLRVYQTSELSTDISGMIVKDKKRGGESGFAIYVNASHAPVRRRFTIAHEIAHYILHENLIGEGIAEDYLLRAGGLSNAVERQANALAADILMPWPLIKESQESGIETIDGLAMHLNVSRDAMSYRLLGIPYEEAQASGHT